jgi:electron transfer flavoprotein beta subunit
VETVINPFDTYAVEEAVRIKERAEEAESKDGVEVIAISMGPPQAESILREAISLGADRAILVSDRAFAGSDTWATALTLKNVIEKFMDWKIVIVGKQTLDGDTAQVGPELAQMLNTQFIGYTSKIIEIGKNKMVLKRLMEDRYETYEVKIPAVISVGKDINIPRVPSLRGKLKAKKEQIPVWDAKKIGIDENKTGLAGSYTQVVKIFTPEHIHEVKMIEGSPDQQAEEIFEKLKELNVL